MNTNKRKKILITSLLAVMMVVPVGLSAQTDGFFSEWDNDGGSRDGEEYGVTATTQTFCTPLGGGMAILVASAAGYALLKRRKNNTKTPKLPKHLKHLNFLLVLTMVSVLFTQCKKAEVVPQTNADAGNTINISLKVDGNSKVNVDPSQGTVGFENGDKIYVASGGHYAGTLICESTSKDLVFRGTITNPVEGAYLYFYFLGNKDATDADGEALSTKSGSESTSLMVNIGYQSSELPVVSYGKSDQVFGIGTKSYKTVLANQCGLVKFTTTGYSGSGNLTIKGMNNKVTVNLSDHSFAYSGKDENGSIAMKKSTDDNYWAILLPQAETTAMACTTDGYATSTSVSVPEIKVNDYNTKGVTVPLTEPQYVDLGLPSGRLWATYNVGACSPEDYGDYYAWGEIEPYYVNGGWNTTMTTGAGNKVYTLFGYSWYTYCKQDESGYFIEWETPPYIDNVLKSDRDAARVNWGGDWRMPTQAEWQELFDGTNHEWVSTDDVKGWKFKNKTDESKYIFLPAAGYREVLLFYDNCCNYWTSLLYSSKDDYAYRFYYDTEYGNEPQVSFEDRCVGLTVRPVR